MTDSWRIPGKLPGILFFVFARAACGQIELAVDLFGEGSYTSCVRECRRVLSDSPAEETALLLLNAAALRLDPGDRRAGGTLDHLSAAAALPEVRAMASYECARRQWRAGDGTNAFAGFARAFEETRSEDLAMRCGFSMVELGRTGRIPASQAAGWPERLRRFEARWTPSVCEECHVRPSTTGAAAKPGEWIVAFYRSQIAPAIGARCSLTPSCSEYFLQASRRYGVLGFPMGADRLVREPSVVQSAETPVWTGSGWRYADPLSDHDFWLVPAPRRVPAAAGVQK